MNVQEVLVDFLRPVAFGTGVVLALILLLGLQMPPRSKVAARPFRPK
jgi:hypothetical protein